LSPSHEPSYYEIALTNRQVLVVFVVLLVCVVTAFFSGVWIGQRASVPSVEAEVAQLGKNAERASADGQQPMSELRFFSDVEESESSSEASDRLAKAPDTKTTLAQDLEAERPSKPVDTKPAPAVETPKAKKAEPEPVAAGSRSGARSGDHVIQVFSSSNEQQARKLIERLGSGGFPAFLERFDDRGQTKFRVRVGPFSSRALANDSAAKVRQQFRLDTWVTQIP